MSEKKITKSDIIDKIYSNSKIEKKVIQDVFEHTLEEFKNALKEGLTIELRGFGTFEPRLRLGREKARNPKTGQTVSVEPHYVAAFRAGKDLKNALLELPVEAEKPSK